VLEKAVDGKDILKITMEASGLRGGHIGKSKQDQSSV
jgi:hypothetical protein